MTKSDFLEKVCEALQKESISSEDIDREGLWDSIGKLSLVAMIDTEMGSGAVDDSIKQAVTIQQILESLESKGLLEKE